MQGQEREKCPKNLFSLLSPQYPGTREIKMPQELILTFVPTICRDKRDKNVPRTYSHFCPHNMQGQER
jgi:hypothetical protein